MKDRFEGKGVRTFFSSSPRGGATIGLDMLFRMSLILVLFLTGCFNTLEQRWKAFDES